MPHRLCQVTKAFGTKGFASNQGLQSGTPTHGYPLEAARAAAFELKAGREWDDFSSGTMMASMAKCFGSDGGP